MRGIEWITASAGAFRLSAVGQLLISLIGNLKIHMDGYRVHRDSAEPANVNSYRV